MPQIKLATELKEPVPKVVRTVLNGGDEETGLCRPRLVATQLECEFFCPALSTEARHVSPSPQPIGTPSALVTVAAAAFPSHTTRLMTGDATAWPPSPCLPTVAWAHP